jgi:hypothetical protein
VGGDHLAGERDVGEVAAIGVKGWVGRVGRPVDREFLGFVNAGERRRGLGR